MSTVSPHCLIMSFFLLYVAAWISACLHALWLLVRHRSTVELLQRRYWHFLLQGWKIVSFILAATILTVVAPYTNDPTWDYVDALAMSLLTYTTAPWAVGTLSRAVKRRASWVKAYVAFCVWLFSASWFFDLYILIRDGSHPTYWLENMFLSSVLYICAGLMWSLEWRETRGVVLQFTEPHWPERVAESRFTKIFWYALPFMVIAAAVIAPFLV